MFFPKKILSIFIFASFCFLGLKSFNPRDEGYQIVRPVRLDSRINPMLLCFKIEANDHVDCMLYNPKTDKRLIYSFDLRWTVGDIGTIRHALDGQKGFYFSPWLKYCVKNKKEQIVPQPVLQQISEQEDAYHKELASSAMQCSRVISSINSFSKIMYFYDSFGCIGTQLMRVPMQKVVTLFPPQAPLVYKRLAELKGQLGIAAYNICINLIFDKYDNMCIRLIKNGAVLEMNVSFITSFMDCALGHELAHLCQQYIREKGINITKTIPFGIELLTDENIKQLLKYNLETHADIVGCLITGSFNNIRLHDKHAKDAFYGRWHYLEKIKNSLDLLKVHLHPCTRSLYLRELMYKYNKTLKWFNKHLHEII